MPISFISIQANSNLYFVSIPWLFCLFPSYIEQSPNLYFGSNPLFLFLIPLYTFNEIQICTSVKPMNVSAHFLYIKIYANPNLYFGSNPSFFFLIPQYTFNEIQIWTSTNPMIFLLILFIYIHRQIQICTFALTFIFHKKIQKQQIHKPTHIEKQELKKISNKDFLKKSNQKFKKI